MQLGLGVGLSKQRRGVISGEIPAVGGDPPGSFDGFETPPTVETIADTVIVRGKTKAGFIGKFVVPLGDLVAGRVYNVNFVADLSGLAQGGAKSGFGFGMKNGNSFRLTLLQGDGVGVNATTVRGSPPNGWNKQTGHTTANGGAPTSGTQHAADVQLVTNAGGDAYTFSTSGDDQETWDAELEDQVLTPFADVTAVEQFGIAGWFASDDAGEFTITVTWTEAAAGEWQVSFQPTLNSDSADFQPYNIRYLIPAANLSVSGGKVRITFESGSASTFTITGCYIGHVDPGGGGGAPNFDGSQVRLTFDGGSNGAVLTAGGTKLSDEITYALDETKDFIVAMYLNGGAGTGVHRQNFAAGVGTRYFKNTATDETPDTTASGYSNGGAATTAVNKLEVFA